MVSKEKSSLIYQNHPNQAANHLHLDGVSLYDIAKKFGTPLYLYSQKQIEATYQQYQDAIDRMQSVKAHIHFAVKSNDRLEILKIYQKLGASFDIVSAGELARLIEIGVEGKDIIFSGVGKTKAEIKMALEHQISSINVESKDELDAIIKICQLENQTGKIVLRVNPDIDAKTHPYISTGLKSNKFGLDFASALELYQSYAQQPEIKFVGISCHIGSQITDLSVFKDAATKVRDFVIQLEKLGIKLQLINLGGGIGIDYEGEQTIAISDFTEMIDRVFAQMPQKIILEPGRSLIGKAGILITEVLYLKDNQDYHFCIVDASMTELIRPCLYQAYHPILEVVQKEQLEQKKWQIVGPVCESADKLGADRELKIEKNDFLAITHAGAYGAVMVSQYNARTKPAEVLIGSDGNVKLIVKRSSIPDLWQDEVFQ